MSCMSNVKYRYDQPLGLAKMSSRANDIYDFVALYRGTYKDFCMYAPGYGYWNVKFYGLFRSRVVRNSQGKIVSETPYVVEKVETE